MTHRGTVLVLTNNADTTACAVVSALLDRGTSAVRWDPADFPLASRLTAFPATDRPYGTINTGDGDLNLGEVSAVYYRRPGPFVFPDTMAGPERSFAQDHGGSVVYKTLAGGVHHEGVQLASTTQLIDADTIDDSVRLTAHLFQEALPKRHEVRLTIVDDSMFVAQIHTHSDASRLDWRADFESLTYATGTVPDDVRAGVTTLMRRFGLLFAAADFVVTPSGHWRFLELNPNGQWAWIERETGLPIAAAIAGLLLR